MAAFPTLAEFKGHLRITGSGDDTRLADVLGAVGEIMEPVVGPATVQSFTEQVEVRGRLVAPRRGPLVTVTSLTPDLGTAVSASLYTVDTDLGVVRLRFFTRGLYTLVYTAGWASYPVSLKQAALVIGQHEWQVRNGTNGRPSPDMDALMPLPGSGFLVPYRAFELMQPKTLHGFG